HLMGVIAEKLPKQVGFEAVRSALKDEISSIMFPVQEHFDAKGLDSLDDKIDGPKPRIWMVVGVNGAGKTTTIGKLAAIHAQKGLKVLVAAGDTFRAAAGGQLKVWSERAQVEIFMQDGNAKPSGVAFDACQKAVKDGFDLVLLDTAGRLHTQLNLMEELKKIKRVVEKVVPGAPHQTLLVLDANSGQNALVQAREFHGALTVNGVILTKLDGTAKGGVAVGLAHELHIPIKAVGIGEKVGDLRPFSTREFVDSIL
ncbi:MAG: signal recognition particle-docking protein FtsY, partial [Bdellovibrionia bacterium]